MTVGKNAITRSSYDIWDDVLVSDMSQKDMLKRMTSERSVLAAESR